jgi:hypothetical protein
MTVDGFKNCCWKNLQLNLQKESRESDFFLKVLERAKSSPQKFAAAATNSHAELRQVGCA